MKVYSIWTEDQSSWAEPHSNPIVWSSKEDAQEYLEKYLKNLDVEYWLEDNLAYVYEITVK